MDKNGDYSIDWLSLEEACEYTGRSSAAIRRWVAAGKIEKQLVPMPGARPRVRLLRRDLNRLFRPVVLGSVSETRAEPEKPDKTEQNTALARAEEALNGLSPLFEKLGELLKRPEIEVERKLTWTLNEARTMTGLSRPMLRDLAESNPEIVLRRGRRMWFMAGRLREVLG